MLKFNKYTSILINEVALSVCLLTVLNRKTDFDETLA